MISYKKIDLIKLNLVNSSLQYGNETVIIKTPIMYFDYKENFILLKINNNSENHIKFLQLCSHIERLFKFKDIKQIADNTIEIKVVVNKESKFYDSNGNLTSNVLPGKIICSLKCFEGIMTLDQLLYIK